MIGPADESGSLELVEVGSLTLRDWVELTERDPDAFGHAEEGLVWRPKDRHACLRDSDGRLVAAGGATVVAVEVGGQRFDVVGMGSLIVHRDLRGSGAMTRVADAMAQIAERMGPARAMIFCLPRLTDMHRARGYRPIDAQVTVDQPDGPVVMTQTAMQRPLRGDAVPWPAGPVAVQGLPF